MNFTLLDDTDVSQAYAAYLRELRQQEKLSRAEKCNLVAFGIQGTTSSPWPTRKLNLKVGYKSNYIE